MDKEALRAHRQKALIQDSIRAAFRERSGDGPTLHPFVLSVQSLRREVEFLQPFTAAPVKPIFAQAAPAYASAQALLAEAEAQILGDSQVAAGAAPLLPLVEYHLALLKIHRTLFTREIEGYGLIPPASPALQRQVARAYEALAGLTDVLASLAKAPAGAARRGAKPRPPARALPPAAAEEPEEPLDLPNRVSPFITDGAKRSTVAIDGVLWPRFV
jgi:hypothetical protein